ncbi:hypothetical protein X798_07868 [Onchocerca flexuosa]|uniref:Uncharacterized protein n=1 Tax=Onchocerca flexuosa TaxID=387005 RepID=A0A238BKW4_9BILA|nr:hypothetical protein X798_07868 [Onchocerca flexuosa]
MDQLKLLADRMIYRLITDQFLDGFSDYQLISIIDANNTHKALTIGKTYSKSSEAELELQFLYRRMNEPGNYITSVQRTEQSLILAIGLLNGSGKLVF